MMNIWQTLPRPFFALAPMEDVTDTVFRRAVAEAGPPHLFFTEFVNVDALVTRGRRAAARRLLHDDSERTLIAQIWGGDPENFRRIAREIAEGVFGPFAGIDLNMGCPERKVVRRGECAGLIGRPNHAIEIIRATKEGAGDLPVSVKTRCGVTEWVTEEWAATLLAEDLAALTIHGRIAAEMSNFPARWEEIAKVVALRDRLAPGTPILGNGDVLSVEDGLEKVAAAGVDGVMVGRGIFRNLWLFDQTIDQTTISLERRLTLLAAYIRHWQEVWGTEKNFEALKKLYKMYFAGVPDSGNLRRELLLLRTAEETLARIALALDESSVVSRQSSVAAR